jgi:hypothetical protein
MRAAHEADGERVGERRIDVADRSELAADPVDAARAVTVRAQVRAGEGGAQRLERDEQRRLERAGRRTSAGRRDEAASLVLGEQLRPGDVLAEPRDQLQGGLQAEHRAARDGRAATGGRGQLLARDVDLRRSTTCGVVPAAGGREPRVDEHVEVTARDVRVDADPLADLAGGVRTALGAQHAVDRGAGRDGQRGPDGALVSVPVGDGDGERRAGARGHDGLRGADGGERRTERRLVRSGGAGLGVAGRRVTGRGRDGRLDSVNRANLACGAEAP